MVVRSGGRWEYGGDGGGGEYVGFYVISTKIDYILISCATTHAVAHEKVILLILVENNI
jgi:hypothetical protein